MIRVNLLPVRAARKREFGRQQLILFALVVVLALIGNYYWWNHTETTIAALNQQIARTRAEIAQLDKTIGEVKSITQEKKALEDKLKILDTLKKGRTGPVRLLDELAGIIPPKVWLLQLEESGNAVTIRGSAATYEDFSTFVKKLKASKYFRDVVIKRAMQRPEGVVEWQLAATADYSAA